MLKGGVLAGSVLPFVPGNWSVPVVESVLLPAHAATSCEQQLSTSYTFTVPCASAETFYSFPIGITSSPCLRLSISAPAVSASKPTDYCLLFRAFPAASPSGTRVQVFAPTGGAQVDHTVANCATSPVWGNTNANPFTVENGACGNSHAFKVDLTFLISANQPQIIIAVSIA